MKKLVVLLVAILPFLSYAQVETNNFRILDTTISLPNITNPFGSPYQWIVEARIPVNYFTPNHPDTASRPALIAMPGQGQQGSANYANLYAYGPAYWYRNGWDAGITIGNGKHFPLIFTIAFVNNVLPQADQYNRLLDSLIKWYHIKRGLPGKSDYSIGITGFSQGAFTNGALIKFEQTAGAETGMRKIACAALFEGEPDQLPAPYNGWDRDTVAYKVWAKKYGGHYFTLEGSGSDNFRNTWKEATAMNDTLPGVAYFSYESLGGGAHCCWNSMWDPSATNWNCVTPPALGPNNAPSQVGKNQIGNYKIGDNIFTWMFRNIGDTSLIGQGGSGGGTLTVQASTDQTIQLPQTSITLSATATAPTGATVTTYLWKQSSGPTTVTIQNAATTTATFNGLTSAGLYVFYVRATDNLADTAYDSVNVTVLSNSCRVFTWDSTNGNINLTSTAFNASPALHRCDTVNILWKSTGYRSFSINGVGVQNDVNSGWITVRGVGRNGKLGAFIAPSNSNLFANVWDNNNWIHVDSIYMQDHIDPFLSKYVVNGYSHHMWLSHINIRGSAGFTSNTPFTSTLPNFNNDTVNCQLDWLIEYCTADSIKGNGSGISAWYSYSTAANQVWLLHEFRYNIFNHYSSLNNPAGYIASANTFGLKIHHNYFGNLSNNVPHPVGHAAELQLLGDYYEIHDNISDSAFGNNCRVSGSGELPAMRAFFKALDSTYDGVSRYYNNLIRWKRKYPVYEPRKNSGLTTGTMPYYLDRRSARVYNGVLFRPGFGIGNDPYHTSYYDSYGGTADTVECKNIVVCGPYTDTAGVWKITLSGTAGPAVGGVPVTLTITPSGKIDTAALVCVQTFPESGLADSVSFYPLLNGILYNNGVPTPSWLNKDFDGLPLPVPNRAPFNRNSGIDIGIRALRSKFCDCLTFPLNTTIQN